MRKKEKEMDKEEKRKMRWTNRKGNEMDHLEKGK